MQIPRPQPKATEPPNSQALRLGEKHGDAAVQQVQQAHWTLPMHPWFENICSVVIFQGNLVGIVIAGPPSNLTGSFSSYTMFCFLSLEGNNST